MLLLGLYAINDEKAQAFFNPFVARTSGESHRSFGDSINDPQGNLGKHPSDFALYQIGTFDPSNGYIDGLKKPVLIARGSDFKNIKNKKEDC